MEQILYMMQKMLTRFDATHEKVKEMRSDLLGIGQKFDAHVVSIKHLQLQISDLSTIVNPWKPGTLLSNTIKNPKNDVHCMSVTAQEGKETIEPCMSSVVEGDMRKQDNVVEASGQLDDETMKEA